MAEYIQEPLMLAQQVAQIMMDHSYRESQSNYGIHDILLFGSTLKKPDQARDIDLLVIHNLTGLGKFGVITTYDGERGKAVPDLERKLEDEKNEANCVLESMGSPLVEYFSDARSEIGEYLRRNFLRDGKLKTLDIPYVGKLNLSDEDYYVLYGKVYDEVSSRVSTLQQDSVYVQMNLLFEGDDTRMDQILDLQIMHGDLLISGRTDEERALAIKQCRDPLFWHEVLETGRLYDPETKIFQIPVEQKYPGALELFKPKS